jgi:LPXTG-motif cell wall-anchored protein
MKKITVVLMLGFIFSALCAGPAFAQRDPFKESGVGGGDASQPVPGSLGQVEPSAPFTTTTTTAADDAVVTANAEQLPATGPEASVWLVIAYMLLALGAGALVLGRLYRAGPN